MTRPELLEELLLLGVGGALVVEHDALVAFAQHVPDEMAAGEPGPAGDENLHVVFRSVRSNGGGFYQKTAGGANAGIVASGLRKAPTVW